MCGEGLIVMLLLGVGLYQFSKGMVKHPSMMAIVGSMFMRFFRK